MTNSRVISHDKSFSYNFREISRNPLYLRRKLRSTYLIVTGDYRQIIQSLHFQT